MNQDEIINQSTMLSNDITNLAIYKTVLEECQKFHSDAIGVTSYIGRQGSDQIYPKQLNFQTILLLKIYDKISTIEQNQSIITREINSLKIGREIMPYISRISYKSW